MRNYRIRIIIYLSLITLLCSLLFVIIPDMLYPPLEQIKNYLHIPVPADASDIRAVYYSWQGSTFYLRFNLPASSFEDFLVALCPRDNQQLDEEYPEVPTWLLRGPDWWVPDAAHISMSGRCFPYPAVDADIFVDQSSDRAMYRIYMKGGTA